MWQTLNINEVEKKLKTNVKNGISKEELKVKKEIYGKNKLEDQKKESIFIKFIKQFNDFMIIILIIASIISAIISKMNGENDYIDSIIIIFIVILNAIMGLVQEEKAEKSIESLKKLTPQIAKIIRAGKIQEIEAIELVPGDIIILEMGNYVPADCRIIECYNLKIEESSLTGEIDAVEKNANEIYDEGVPLGDMKNLAFMGSIVVNGHGKAIVTEIGMQTKIGKIAGMITKEDSPETPIQKKLSEVGKILGIACLAICMLVFLIGVIKKIDPIEMFMTAVGLAVAAIPEGLPAVVTIMLSIGVTKMSKNNSIIRKLPAVETLGCSNVICSDKTGTLTQNKMTVIKTFSDNEVLLLKYGSMCTNVEFEYKKGTYIAIGEPTEKAIVDKALIKGINLIELKEEMKRVYEIPFDSKRKMMTTVYKNNDEYILITKGAPEILLSKCSKIYKDKKERNINSEDKNNINNQNNYMANEALRVIAVGYKIIKNIDDKNKLEESITFLGLIGMIDPPKEGVKEAIHICKNAGIKTVMITGDHIITAKAIAKDLGILKMGDKYITGEELNKLSDKELENNIKKYSVFARVTPEHKVRIVKAWQNAGAVVAMTGDGVNDSPALKKADIGIAMGKGGTDVAKNAADMILVDDNFTTIVKAVKQGRNIYDNIRKSVHFLISTNIGEIVTIFLGLIMGIKTPLLAIQLLWINLVTDSFPAIALGLEKAENGIMNKKPRDSKKSIFSDGLWNSIILEGIMIGSLTLFAFSLGNKLFNLEVARTMAFVTMGLTELIHSLNIKTEESILKSGIFENKYLILSILVGSIVQTIVVIIPPFASVFKLVTLNKIQWIYTILISLSPILIMEVQKKINEIKFGKIIYKNLNKTSF